MEPFKVTENLGYGICLNSCKCQVFNTSRSPTNYEVIKRGSLVKFQYRKCKIGSVRTLVTNKSEVYMKDSLHYIAIDLKLFKYLNAINDFEERVQFYTNSKRCQFVLHLERNSDVSVSSRGQQTKAVFQEIYETEEKIFITVELLDRPFKYSLPANMIHTIASLDLRQNNNRDRLKFWRRIPIFRSNFDYSTLAYWRCSDNVQNHNTSNVSRGKSVSKSVEPVKKNISQNSDKSYKPASNNEPINENRCGTRDDSALMVPSSSSTDILINSRVCLICLIIVSEDDICVSCTNKMKQIYGENNSQTKIVSNISVDKCLSSETRISPLEINYRYVTNEDHLSDNSNIAVRYNISASNCIICKKHLNVSDGFFLMLCQHTFCELCIKNQINLKMLAHTNILPCCDRPIEQDEIKYFLYKHEYEQFKQSETSVGPALFVSSNSSTDISINSAVSVPGSNVCESINCDDNKEKIVKENNSEAKDTSVPTDILINSKVCLDCLNVYEGNICPKCDLEKISAQNNPLINVDSNISSYSSLTSETSINSFEINHGINNWETNENDLSDNSNMAVIHNISASNCIICKKDFDISEGFFFVLCKHSICKMCIKNQTSLKKLAHINIMPCCDRPIELDEKKYFSDIQQCFDKNCSAYYLWEECGEERSNTFTCNKCEFENCLKCRKIHVGLTCEKYDKLIGDRNSVDRETVEMLLTWIREGIAMPCPNCEALIEKDEGYDYVKCPFCDMEICWATRGPRWGPNGKGDTSGGCGCDFKVKKCVDNCNFCG